ncbi:MAG: hypothetical protein M9894_06785 [Planctomycetes bacterium]|nr:hypothetical protein [Planctomycetota bacterium]
MRLTSRLTAARPFVGPLLVLVALAPAAAQDKPSPPQAPVATDDPEQAARAEIEAGLDRRLSVRFDATPLEEVVAFVQDLTGLNVALDPEAAAVDHPVTLALQDVTLRAVLDQALAGSGVQMRVWSGALVLTRGGKDLGDPPRPGNGPAAQAAAGRRLSLELSGTPLAEVLDFLGEVTSLDVVVAADAQRRVDDAAVRLRLRDVSLGQALTLVTHLHGLTWRAEGGSLQVERRRPRERVVAPAVPGGPLSKQEVEARLAAPVTLRVDDGTLFDLAAQVEARSGLRVRLENAGKDDIVSLHLEGVPLREALDIVCDVQGARWTVEEGGVLVLQVLTRCETCGEPRGNVSPCPACGAR